MRKKKIRKVKIKSFLILFLILGIIAFLVWIFFQIKVTNIYVSGNSILKEYEIISLANLEDYPKISDISKKEVKNNLLENPFIDDCDISVSLLGKVEIIITEASVLYQNKDDSYTLSNGKNTLIDNYYIGVPILTNIIDTQVFDKFIKCFSLINDEIRIKISEISYAGTDLDIERFLFYMNDHNHVYVTLDKIENINSYNEIYPTLEGKTGILYLDSGNYFGIKDK